MSLCGYSGSLVCAHFRFGRDNTVPLAAFAHEPMDARSACVAIIQASAGDVRSQVSSCRQLGAPIVIALSPGAVEFWKQREDNPELVEQVVAEKAEAYFRKHQSDLSPEAVFRAKTWGRLDRQFQLSFVDAGLMPLVEKETGQRLTALIERVVHGLRGALWPRMPKIIMRDLWNGLAFYLVELAIVFRQGAFGLRAVAGAFTDRVIFDVQPDHHLTSTSNPQDRKRTDHRV